MKDYPGIASACLILQGIHWGDAKEYKRALFYAYYGESIAEKYNVIGYIQFPVSVLPRCISLKLPKFMC
jgi:hypothetical protein